MDTKTKSKWTYLFENIRLICFILLVLGVSIAYLQHIYYPPGSEKTLETEKPLITDHYFIIDKAEDFESAGFGAKIYYLRDGTTQQEYVLTVSKTSAAFTRHESKEIIPKGEKNNGEATTDHQSGNQD